MRRLTFVLFCLCAMPLAAQQATPPAGKPTPPPGQAAPPADKVAPPAEKAAPPAGQPVPPAGQAGPGDKGAVPADQVAGPSGGADADGSLSLFEHAPNQVEIGGRLTTTSGDPARFQRYRDFRDG